MWIIYKNIRTERWPHIWCFNNPIWYIQDTVKNPVMVMWLTPSANLFWPHKRGGHIAGVQYSEKCHLVKCPHNRGGIYWGWPHRRGYIYFIQVKVVSVTETCKRLWLYKFVYIEWLCFFWHIYSLFNLWQEICWIFFSGRTIYNRDIK